MTGWSFRFGCALVSALALSAVSGCGPSESPAELAHGRAELTGDSPLVEHFREAEREHGVPAELLATIGWVQTRLSMQSDAGDEHADHAHAPREWGLMAIGTGGLTTLDQAAALTKTSSERIATDARANVLAAAALMAAEAERRGARPASDEGWAPIIAAYGGEALAERVLELTAAGWQGSDDAGFSVAVRGHGSGDVIKTVQQGLGYPGAKWSAASSSNYNAASRGAAQINYVIIHTVQGSYSGCISWFKNPASNVSAHYVVRSSDGEITQMVDDSDIAWHDACFNSQTIGIEHEGYVSDPGKWYTDAMYKSSAKLTRWLADQYGIPLDRDHIMGHGEAPDCSSHTDPGPGWNWDKYMDLVINGECSPKPEVCNAKDDDCDGATDEGDVCVLSELVVPGAGGLDTKTSDVDGDGLADVCARSSAGFSCYTAGGGAFSDQVAGPELSNAKGWGDPKYYATIRMGDVNGDGKADVCARGSAGVSCWLSDGGGFPEQIAGPEWSDANGWGDVRFWSTIRLLDFDGDGSDDICARAAAGIRCHKSNGAGFGDSIVGPEMSDDTGWGSEKYFATLRASDVNGDGKADLCARHSQGFSCWLSDGAGFPTKIDGPELSDAKGWGNVSYWSTIRLSDVSGDGKADVCARGAAGFHCWLSNGSGFGDAITGPDMGDAQGWDVPEYYGTFRIADIDGDGKADVCGRGYSGVVCWPFDGASFGAKIAGPEWGDANGWNKVQYYSTLQLASGPQGSGGDGGSAGGAGSSGSGAGGGSSGSGGSGWAGSGSGGDGANAAKPDGAGEESGCGCRQAGSPARSGFAGLLAAALMLLARRRR